MVSNNSTSNNSSGMIPVKNFKLEDWQEKQSL
jgi:hypothetical protein